MNPVALNFHGPTSGPTGGYLESPVNRGPVLLVALVHLTLLFAGIYMVLWFLSTARLLLNYLKPIFNFSRTSRTSRTKPVMTRVATVLLILKYGDQ